MTIDHTQCWMKTDRQEVVCWYYSLIKQTKWVGFVNIVNNTQHSLQGHVPSTKPMVELMYVCHAMCVYPVCWSTTRVQHMKPKEDVKIQMTQKLSLPCLRNLQYNTDGDHLRWSRNGWPAQQTLKCVLEFHWNVYLSIFIQWKWSISMKFSRTFESMDINPRVR